MSKIIPYRPRSEVAPRRVPIVRSEAPEFLLDEPQPLTVAAGIQFMKLWQALYADGFALVYDQRTSCFIVREKEPRP